MLVSSKDQILMEQFVSSAKFIKTFPLMSTLATPPTLHWPKYLCEGQMKKKLLPSQNP